MLEILKRMILEFQERPMRKVATRNLRFPMLEGKATIITGMRRTGKTSFCYQKMTELIVAGTDKTQLLYLNFEDDRLYGFKVNNCQSILDAFYSLYPENRQKECYFFFDEIQNVVDWERFVRRLLDTTDIHVVLTGSSSKLLTVEIATAMRGRSICQEVLPFSFEEFLYYKDVFKTIPENLSDNDIAHLRHEIEYYFRIGGFPEVYQYPDVATRGEILQEYSNMVVLKDVVERHNISNPTALRYLVSSLYNADAQKFSVTNFWKMLNKGMQVKCSKNDLFAFMKYLEEAYIIFRTELHTNSQKAKLVNPNKVYLIDVGLVRAMVEDPEANRGWLLENLVYLHLRRLKFDVSYYNTFDNKEVDFYAFNRISREKMLIQSTWSLSDPETAKREIAPLVTAGTELNISKRIIVTWNEETELADSIKVVPLWKFLINHY
jgi:ATPase